MKTEIRLLKPGEFLQEFPEDFLKKMPLYNQPFYADLIKPGKLRYGKMEIDNSEVFYFPVSTDRLLLQRRVFILPYCQRFTPIGLHQKSPGIQVIQEWTNWLDKNTSRCQWAFSSAEAKGFFSEKTNQFLNLSQDAETLFKSWKKGRKSALQKSSGLKTEVLSAAEFSTALQQLNRHNSSQGWKPDAFEMAAILRISEAKEIENNLERYGIFEGGECLSLILLFRWNERWHYLFSQSSERGFELDSLTRFFYFMIESKAGSPFLFDFEGSSLPGVKAFFNSLGAREEVYFEFRKD